MLDRRLHPPRIAARSIPTSSSSPGPARSGSPSSARGRARRHRRLEAERAGLLLSCTTPERTTWVSFTDAEREALATHDHPALFELGAHPFLTLTLFIAMFERDSEVPLGYQREYAARLAHFSLPYPDIAT